MRLQHKRRKEATGGCSVHDLLVNVTIEVNETMMRISELHKFQTGEDGKMISNTRLNTRTWHMLNKGSEGSGRP